MIEANDSGDDALLEALSSLDAKPKSLQTNVASNAARGPRKAISGGASAHGSLLVSCWRRLKSFNLFCKRSRASVFANRVYA